MKLLAIDCYKTDDTTAGKKLLDSFIKGAKSAGADVETILISDKKILKCKKCTEQIDFESPKDHCYQNDDMNDLYPILKESDIWLFGFSYCLSSPNECLGNFLDRFEPLFKVNDSENGNKTDGKVVILSTCSFWDKETFNPILEQFKDFCSIYSKEFNTALLRPGAIALDKLNGSSNISEVFDAAYFAGQSLIKDGFVPDVLKEQFSKDIIERHRINIS